MKRSTNGILTTHTGSLARPPELRALLVAREEGKPFDSGAFDTVVRRAVADVVKHQAEAGITVLNDGEQSKYLYGSYARQRLTGFEEDTAPRSIIPGESRDYPEYFARRRPNPRWACCTGPVSWKDFSAVQKDIDNLKAATKGVKAEDVFMSASSPGITTYFLPNRYYPSQEAYLYAVADVMKREYEAIAQAGFVVQLDCPDLAMLARTHLPPDMPLPEFRKLVALHVEVLNYATRDIPPDQMRIHVCWGADEAPHTRDVALKDVVDLILKARPMGMTIVGANGRHEYEWKVWKDIKLPDDKVIIPGVIDSTTNIIEHPETVAERIVRYANVLGRENIIAGVDCGFSPSVANEQPLVDPKIVWAKLRSLAQGAELATKELWRR